MHKNLNKLANDNLVTGFDFDVKTEPCEPCLHGKLHKCPLPTNGARRADEPLGLVHSDVCGEITPKSAGGAEYFFTFTDDKTRYVWVYALKQKSEVVSKFCEWKALVEKSSGHKLKTLRTDNGSEFMSSEFQNFPKIEGVRHELTVPKTPQQNGVAKRLNRTLVHVESARTMLIQARLPQKFWVEVLNTTVYLHNRSLTRAVDRATPSGAWTGVKPDVKYLRSFGCTAYAHTPKDERKKFDSNARKCVFLGYGTETKGYRLYDCERQRVIFSRDVNFNGSEVGIEKETSDGTDELVTIELSSNDSAAQDAETTKWQSTRERRLPNRLGEWVTVASEDIAEPTTVREVLSGPYAEQWHKAMQQEINSLHKHDVWTLTELLGVGK